MDIAEGHDVPPVTVRPTHGVGLSKEEGRTVSREPLGKAQHRPYHARGRKVPGVYQRCFAACPSPCATHTWSFHVELPPGPDGRRRQATDGGFASGRAAADARAKVVAADRNGQLALDARKTFGDWLDEWIDAKVARGEIRDSTERGYRDNIKNHLKPRLGGMKLAELRGVDLAAPDLCQDRCRPRG